MPSTVKSRFLWSMTATLLCAVPAFAAGPAVKPSTKTPVSVAARCTVKPATYKGWKVTELSNAWVKLDVLPQIGGRLIQVTFNGHEYLFVNDALKGQVIPPKEAGNKWNNYGGDKIWPMPEGNQDEQHWAGAGGEPLDNAPFLLKVLSQGTKCAVRMTGPVDPAIGQQYIRDITIGTDSPEIHFHAVMKNVTAYPQTWSEQSVSQYNTADPADPTHPNKQLLGITPANPSSIFPGGFKPRNGNTNPAYGVKDGLFKVDWGTPGMGGGEVWVDSPGGYLAVADGASNYTMVERNAYNPKATYPGDTTMIFFTTGNRPRPANANANGQGNATAPANNFLPVIYMEAEVNSPMVELAPGESYAMDTTWYPTRMGEDFKAATWSGVVGKSLAANAANGSLTLTGDFGVFYVGTLVANYYGRGGQPSGSATVATVTPTEPVHLQTTVQAPEGTFRVSLHLIDKSGADRGPLGEAMVNPPPAGGGRRGGGNGQ